MAFPGKIESVNRRRADCTKADALNHERAPQVSACVSAPSSFWLLAPGFFRTAPGFYPLFPPGLFSWK
jgi:hypothetical protein